MTFYEDMFYDYGVDLVLAGHVHAYERTHGMYKYKRDSCGPAYITIGDGGNAEGPTRSNVDDPVPTTSSGFATYCDAELTRETPNGPAGRTPNEVVAAGNTAWGVGYQIRVSVILSHRT